MDIKQITEELSKLIEDESPLKIDDHLIKTLTFAGVPHEELSNYLKVSSLDSLKSNIKKQNKFPNNFIYKGGLFTLDSYDMSGKELTYASPELDLGIVVETPQNRYNYKDNFKEMEINTWEDESPSYSFLITYYVPEDVYNYVRAQKQ